MSSITLNDLADTSHPIGVECLHCLNRAILTPKAVHAKRGDMRTLSAAGVRCGKCGSKQFSVVRFESRGKAHAFLRNL